MKKIFLISILTSLLFARIEYDKDSYSSATPTTVKDIYKKYVNSEDKKVGDVLDYIQKTYGIKVKILINEKDIFYNEKINRNDIFTLKGNLDFIIANFTENNICWYIFNDEIYIDYELTYKKKVKNPIELKNILDKYTISTNTKIINDYIYVKTNSLDNERVINIINKF